jgi:hypothetical protein
VRQSCAWNRGEDFTTEQLFSWYVFLLLPLRLTFKAWTIGRSIALSRSLKQDPIASLLSSENGVLIFTGKIISVTRQVAEGFTRGCVLLESFSQRNDSLLKTLVIDFENENLIAKLQVKGEEKVLACCPDLIVVLDKANGAPLGISDYKYGLRVSVVALRAPPVWTSEKGLEMGGPRAFGYVCPSHFIVIADYPGLIWTTQVLVLIQGHMNHRKAYGRCSAKGHKHFHFSLPLS